MARASLMATTPSMGCMVSVRKSELDCRAAVDAVVSRRVVQVREARLAGRSQRLSFPREERTGAANDAQAARRASSSLAPSTVRQVLFSNANANHRVAVQESVVLSGDYVAVSLAIAELEKRKTAAE